MNEHEQNRTDGDSPEVCYLSPPPRVRRRLSSYWGAALVAVALLGCGYYALTGTITPEGSSLEEEQDQDLPPSEKWAHDYQKWDQPLLALVLSGQMHGYINPCGCSSPQFGGLVRRYNFIDSLRAGDDKKKGWQVVGVDLGELPQLQGIHAQSMLKYDLALKALRTMQYRAVGVGKNEVLSPLGEALAQAYDKDHPLPRPLALSLAQTAPGQLYYELNVRPYEIVKETTPKVGIISMMGPDLREQLKSKENFVNNAEELPKALNALAEAGVEFGIILHHEYPKVEEEVTGIKRMQEVEKKRKEMALMCARFCAEQRKKNPKIPPIQLMMILTDEPEPPSTIRPIAPDLPTQVVEIGHKGKYVGLLGIYPEGKKYRLQYQIVPMGPEWETKDDQKAGQPVVALMEKYHQELQRQNMLAKFPRTLHYNQIPGPNQKGLKASYVGSETCKECHEHAFTVWKGTHHAKATATLEKLQNPAGQHYDPECMMCHTVGFKHPGGYNNVVDAGLWPAKSPQPIKAADLQAHNEALRGVGCESCHGPASEHVKNPRDKEIRMLINPDGPSKKERELIALLKTNGPDAKVMATVQKMAEGRVHRFEQSCIKCHDHENDVQWGKPGRDIVDNWAKVKHYTPRNNGGPANLVIPPPAPLPLQVQPANLGGPRFPERDLEFNQQK